MPVCILSYFDLNKTNLTGGCSVEKWSYRILQEANGVRTSVPKSAFMKFFEGHTFEAEQGSVTVPDHWRHGTKIKGGHLNRHFFGINEFDMGRGITATVRIIEKKRGDATYVVVDIIKTLGVSAVADLRISPEKKEVGVLIPGTETRVSIIPR